MSKKPYVLTPQARQSLRAARLWSKGRWGDEFTKQYFEDLNKAAYYVAENHKILVSREDLAGTAGLGIYSVREHYLVFVPISDKQLAIVDVIRQGRDVPAILAKYAPLIKKEIQAIKKAKRNHH